ncbi:PrsW family intramembrane metalloprotease [Stomatohabitans albus]|uniref:PrsW family intramembrane metalloprotease n=1 Tax=Stomatohabitans albus TaxID=3110766 RepID=UPI00300D9B6A
MTSFWIQPKNAWWWFNLIVTPIGLIVTAFLYGPLVMSLSPEIISLSFVFYAVMAVAGLLVLRFTKFGTALPSKVLVTAFIWGSINAIGLAITLGLGVGNLSTLTGSTMWISSLGGAVPEEIFKLFCALAVLYLARAWVSHPVHAMLIGMAVGFGFDLAENVSYGLNMALIDSNSDLQPMLSSWLLRLVVGPLAHMIWTGLAGWGMGQFLFEKKRSGLGWLFFTIGIHFLFNTDWPLDAVVPEAALEPVSLAIALAFYVISAIALIVVWRRAPTPQLLSANPELGGVSA